MYVAIDTSTQTGYVLGRVQARHETLRAAKERASQLISTRGSLGVVRKIVDGEVALGEAVGFYDRRLSFTTGSKG